MIHNICPYCRSDTVMVKDRKSRRWHACEAGTTARHRCAHWRNAEVDAHTPHEPEELEQQLARAADDGWPNHDLVTHDPKTVASECGAGSTKLATA
jgi:hypothetical protein